MVVNNRALCIRSRCIIVLSSSSDHDKATTSDYEIICIHHDAESVPHCACKNSLTGFSSRYGERIVISKSAPIDYFQNANSKPSATSQSVAFIIHCEPTNRATASAIMGLGTMPFDTPVVGSRSSGIVDVALKTLNDNESSKLHSTITTMRRPPINYITATITTMSPRNTATATSPPNTNSSAETPRQ